MFFFFLANFNTSNKGCCNNVVNNLDRKCIRYDTQMKYVFKIK